MNRSDAWERFAQCRRLQPDALQVLVSADIVDALLDDHDDEDCPCEPYAEPLHGGWHGYRPSCHTCGVLGGIRLSKDAASFDACVAAKRCPHYHEEAA